ncbi:Transcription elongation factor GreB [Rhodanobacter lindaniclasticus]
MPRARRELHSGRPGAAGELADLAGRLDRRLAIRLCQGFLASWPKDAQGPHYALPLARMAETEPERAAETSQLLQRMLDAWPDHPLARQLAARRRHSTAAHEPLAPALPGSTAIISRDGFERLKAELDHLWRVVRPEVVKAITAAAAEGDRSENAEVPIAEAAGRDRSPRPLPEQTHPRAQGGRGQPRRSRPGVLRRADRTGERRHRRGTALPHRRHDETDASEGRISIDSPLARAALSVSTTSSPPNCRAAPPPSPSWRWTTAEACAADPAPAYRAGNRARSGPAASAAPAG